MKLIVAGSRDFNDYKVLSKILTKFHATYNITEIVSGTAKGADILGEQWANDNGINIKRFPTQWYVNGKYDKSAGYKRNVQMADYLEFNDACIVFWKNNSKGSKHMIDICVDKSIKCWYITFNNGVEIHRAK